MTAKREETPGKALAGRPGQVERPKLGRNREQAAERER